MEKIRVDFFDILGYLIPGIILLMVLWICVDSNVTTIWQVYDSIHKIDNKSVFLAIFLAYIAGFILHALGNLIFNVFLSKKILSLSSTELANDWAIIREYGEKHISILERWYALRALSQNLCAICIFSTAVSLYKLYKFFSIEWLFFSFFSLILFFVLLKRAEIFNNYLIKDIIATLNLDLEKKNVTSKTSV